MVRGLLDYFLKEATKQLLELWPLYFLVSLLFDSFLASIQTCQNMATRFKVCMSSCLSVINCILLDIDNIYFILGFND